MSPRALWILAALGTVLLVPSCTALQELAALRTVTFAFAGISDVRVAGVRITEATTYASLGVTDAGRLAAAVLAKDVPLELTAHVRATNPSENTVSASITALDWTLFIEDRNTASGGLTAPLSIAPGASAEIPLGARVDLLQLGTGGARDLFDLALEIAGYGLSQKELRLEMAPTIETPLGPIRYPAPVVVRRGNASR